MDFSIDEREILRNKKILLQGEMLGAYTNIDRIVSAQLDLMGVVSCLKQMLRVKEGLFFPQDYQRNLTFSTGPVITKL